MCGRFGSSFTGKELSERFETTGTIPKFDQSYNVAPGSLIPTVTRNSPNKAVMMRWGFLPGWADPVKFKLHPINARDDQVFVSGFYKSAISKNRCIIPFSWFYEWKKFNKGGELLKQPYLIKVKGEPLCGFAGLYSERKDAEGRPHYTCAIITTKPNKLMSAIHNRMPVILDEKDENAWLDSETNLDEIKGLLKPYRGEMEAYKISTLVNSPRNDSEEIIKPI